MSVGNPVTRPRKFSRLVTRTIFREANPQPATRIIFVIIIKLIIMKEGADTAI